jgi:hypothetical protein
LIVLLAFVPHASTAEKRVVAELELLSEEDANRTEGVSVSTNVSLDVLGPSTTTRNKFSERIEDNEIEDLILCRDCGREITLGSLFTRQASPEASLETRNGTVLGQQRAVVHRFRNPAGIIFRVITVSNSTCVGRGEWVASDTWFPGYAWRICVCPHCSSHKGWMFEPLTNIHGSHDDDERKEGQRRQANVRPSRPSS